MRVFVADAVRGRTYLVGDRRSLAIVASSIEKLLYHNRTTRAKRDNFEWEEQNYALAATGKSLPWPAPEALLLKFVAHHLWDPQKRSENPDHGMPADVEQGLRGQGFLKAVGPHAPDTVRRRLANWSTLTKWRGVSGAFASPALKSAIRLAVRATPHPRKRKSAKAVTGDVLAKMLATCSSGSLRDIRDRAILMVAFASGGRRRSEVAGLRVEQLTTEAPIVERWGGRSVACPFGP